MSDVEEPALGGSFLIQKVLVITQPLSVNAGLKSHVCCLRRHLLDEPTVQDKAGRCEPHKSVRCHRGPHAEEPAQTAL